MSGSKNAAGPEIAEKGLPTLSCPPLLSSLLSLIREILEHFDAQSQVVKLDKHGLPLSPQPSDDPEDPRTPIIASSFFHPRYS